MSGAWPSGVRAEPVPEYVREIILSFLSAADHVNRYFSEVGHARRAICPDLGPSFRNTGGTCSAGKKDDWPVTSMTNPTIEPILLLPCGCPAQVFSQSPLCNFT